MRLFVISILAILAIFLSANDFENAKTAYQTSDYTKAKTLFEVTCYNNNNPQSCAILAVMYVNGQGVIKDIAKAKELYKKSCDYHFELGCKGYNELSAN